MVASQCVVVIQTQVYMDVCVGVYEHVHTPELVPGIEDSHVSRDGVKATASYDVHSLLSCLAVVVQLHAL